MIEESLLVSVCIAVYNRENFIENAIKSVLEQTYQNFEIIIINDGSTDGSLEVIKRFVDPRIRIFSNDRNRGVTYTRNRYLDKSLGDLIAVLDSDDLWLDTKLEKQVGIFIANPSIGLVGTSATKVYHNGTSDLWSYPSQDQGIRDRLLFGSSMVHSSLIVRSSIIRSNDIMYDETLKQGEDYDFIRQIVRHTKAENLKESLVKYYVHEDQFTSTAKEEQVNESFKVAKRYIGDLRVNLGKEELEIYKKVYYYKLALDFSELNKLKLIFNSFVKGLDGILEDQSDIKKRWFLSCYYSSKIGFKSFSIYYDNNILRMKTLFNVKTLKFILKCMIKK